MSSGDAELEGDTSCPDALSVFLARRAPDSSHKRPERQSVVSYDYSEEELMASIEREYCR